MGHKIIDDDRRDRGQHRQQQNRPCTDGRDDRDDQRAEAAQNSRKHRVKNKRANHRQQAHGQRRHKKRPAVGNEFGNLRQNTDPVYRLQALHDFAADSIPVNLAEDCVDGLQHIQCQRAQRREQPRPVNRGNHRHDIVSEVVPVCALYRRDQRVQQADGKAAHTQSSFQPRNIGDGRIDAHCNAIA